MKTVFWKQTVTPRKKTNWFKEKVIFWEYLFVSKCWYKFSSKLNRVPIYILTNNSSAHFLKSISLILIQFRVKKTFEENPISARGEKTNFSRLHWDQRPKSKILNWQTENKLFCGLMSINIKITLVDFVKCENVWKLADMGWRHLVAAARCQQESEFCTTNTTLQTLLKNQTSNNTDQTLHKD